MSKFGRCRLCKYELPDDRCSCCATCLHSRVAILEDTLQSIGRVCLHKEDAAIWEIIKETIGEYGEKRIA